MKPIIITREVWRPIDQCPYTEGEKYLVRTSKDWIVKVKAIGGLLYRAVKGGYIEPVTDGTKFILYPQDDLVKAEENACNDIPLEIIYPYLIRSLRKAEKDLRVSRQDTILVRKEKLKVETDMMILRKEIERLKKEKKADEEAQKAKQRLEFQTQVVKDVRKILGLMIGGDTKENNDRIKFIIERLMMEGGE